MKNNFKFVILEDEKISSNYPSPTILQWTSYNQHQNYAYSSILLPLSSLNYPPPPIIT